MEQYEFRKSFCQPAARAWKPTVQGNRAESVEKQFQTATPNGQLTIMDEEQKELCKLLKY